MPNMRPAHRLLYVVGGIGLIAVALLAPSLNRPWPWILIVGGAVMLLEAAAGF